LFRALDLNWSTPIRAVIDPDAYRGNRRNASLIIRSEVGGEILKSHSAVNGNLELLRFVDDFEAIGMAPGSTAD